jgi:hypothetical protein
MRTKRLIQGLNNSQKIRVIVDGVGFVTAVQDVESMPFVNQRVAVHSVLLSIGLGGQQSLATRQRVYTEHQGYVEYQVQVDLI